MQDSGHSLNISDELVQLFLSTPQGQVHLLTILVILLQQFRCTRLRICLHSNGLQCFAIFRGRKNFEMSLDDSHEKNTYPHYHTPVVPSYSFVFTEHDSQLPYKTSISRSTMSRGYGKRGPLLSVQAIATLLSPMLVRRKGIRTTF